jgi:hypothetical protein
MTADSVLPLVSLEVPERSAPTRTEYEEERSNSCVPTVDDVETCVGHEGHKIVEFHSSVFVKVSKRTAMSSAFHPEVDHEEAAAGLEDATNLAYTLLASGSAQMVEHHRTQSDVELHVRKRERLGAGDLECDIDGGPCSLLSRTIDHRRRGVDPANGTGAYASLRGDGERPGSATDVQDRFAG